VESGDGRNGLVADLVYDARGLLCPLPIIGAAERIAGMEKGSVLEVISDDPGIREDMPAWCESAGHVLLGLVRDGRDYRSFVRKRGRE
jgi:TusA-related sulfurtransferase